MTPMTTVQRLPHVAPGKISDCGFFASCPTTGKVYARVDQPNFRETGSSTIDNALKSFSNLHRMEKLIEEVSLEPGVLINPDAAVQAFIDLANPELIRSSGDLRTGLNELAKAANIDAAYNGGARFQEILTLMRPLAEQIESQK